MASLNAEICKEGLLHARALKEMFSHRVPAETHRAKLSHIRRISKESLQEYVSRVRANACLDIRHTTTYEQLLVQHFLMGIQDKTLAYEVRIRHPRTLNEAMDLQINNHVIVKLLN